MDSHTKNKSNHQELSNSKPINLNPPNDAHLVHDNLPSEEESELEIESDSEINFEENSSEQQAVSLFF